MDKIRLSARGKGFITISVKLRASNNQEKALTLIDVLVVLGVIVILMLEADMFFGDPDPNGKSKAQRINCVNNLKEASLGSWIWAGDHNDKFPMQISITNGGAMECAQKGDVVRIFQIMSNQLATPKILYCTADTDHTWATNFSTDFSVAKISYFVDVDAEKKRPRSVFIGDDNFEVSGVPVKAGLLQVPANASIGWTAARHKFNGNIGFADGSVEQTTSFSLAANFTNGLTQLAIP